MKNKQHQHNHKEEKNNKQSKNNIKQKHIKYVCVPDYTC